jgi:hypothetical protein
MGPSFALGLPRGLAYLLHWQVQLEPVRDAAEFEIFYRRSYKSA